MRVTLAVTAVLAVAPAVPGAAATCTPAVQWIWDGATQGGGYPDVCTTPLVLQLTDDNGDARIDSSDMPDVVFLHSSNAGSQAVITAVDGSTGIEHWTTTAPEVLPTPLGAADLDGDGLVEIVAAHADTVHLVAFEHDGSLRWTSAPSPTPLYEFSVLNIADLDQDGSPEIFTGATVFGADGSLLWEGSAGRGVEGYWNLIAISNASEVDPASPGLELMAGNTLYDARGNILWNQSTLPDGFTTIGDLDLDGKPEIVLATNDQVFALDAQGNVLGPARLVPGRVLSQPLIADLDGDGRPEVIAINDYIVDVFDWSGTGWIDKWSAATDDDTRLDGASAYDLDGDGAAELFYHDSFRWYIFDGRTGAALSTIDLISATLTDVPVIADIDHDCVTEILVGSCQGGIPFQSPNQLIAYECAGSRPARPMWNEYGYHVTNVNDDGSIPRVEVPNWTAGNSWQTQVGGGGPAAAAGLPIDLCATGPVTLDGSASSGCAGGFEYRWRDGAAVRCDWSGVPTCSVTPPALPRTYTLDVRCVGQAGCEASATVDVRLAPGPTAVGGPPVETCTGASATLDGSASSGCSSGFEFRWRDGAALACDWSTSPTCTVTPPSSPRTYSLDVRCAGGPGCIGSATTAVTVVPDPIARAGADASVCEREPLTLDGAGSSAPACPAGLLYEWREGAVVVRAASPVPTWAPPVTPPGIRTYTLAVWCSTGRNCEKTDDVVVDVRDCPLSVRFERFGVMRSGGLAEVAWRTLSEIGTLGFEVEHADLPDGPWQPAGDPIEARGASFDYRVLDRDPRSWYRIVERTMSGRGDQTPPFTLLQPAGDHGGSARERRARRDR